MQTLSRWWDLGITVAVLAATVIVVFSRPDPRDIVVAAVALMLLVGGWLVAGRRATEGSPLAVGFSVVLVVATGALVSIEPILAILQTVAYPLVWMLAGGTRVAVGFNIAVAASVGTGMFIQSGARPDSLVSVLTTVVLSLAFSLAIGFWITSIARLSEERRDLLDTLTAAQAELALLHRDAGVTSERERLARELHDTIAQSLAGLVLLSQRARRDLAGGALADETLELIEDGTRQALAETRALVAGAAPVELSAGLVAALGRLADRFSRETGIAVTSASDLPVGMILDRDAEVVLLRTAQEGLANVRKHSGATSARLELGVDDGAAVLRVVDDGRGFDPESAPGGFGLSGLRDRLALVGGSVDVDGEPGATTLTARLPIGAAS